MTRGQARKFGDKACKVCSLPPAVRDEVDNMLLNGTKQSMIISRVRKAAPDAPPLNASNLSRHKKNHLMNQPITVVGEDGEKTTYITGARPATAPMVNEDALAKLPITLQDALEHIITTGLSNAMANPAWVTPQVWATAIQELRKMGGGQGDKFEDAWRKTGKRKKRTRRVTVEESEEEESDSAPAPQAEVVEGEVITDEEAAWGWEAPAQLEDKGGE